MGQKLVKITQTITLKPYTMKTRLLILSLLIAATGFAQSTVKFDQTSYNYGKIKKGIHKSVIFGFTNQGAKPAVIEFATAECGCTQPEYNQNPVLKGQKGTLKVTYTAPNEGLFKKRVSVKFAGEKAVTELVIEGEVVLK
ncbi:MAG: DUF1573 domain-containing protein [Sediminibacterium sp.]|nr:MAG: DUF1573 domain-containing protein [Sediminibacterium sp.]